MASNKDGTDLERGTSPAAAPAGTSPCPKGENALQAVCGARAELLGFVLRNSTAHVRLALGVGQSTVMRLRGGYWPNDARKLVAAWESYKGRTASQQSRWFLRRVQAGGAVVHAGQAWGSPGLAGRVGETIACARSTGGLLAQTLELPSARFELVPAHAQA